MGCICDRGRTGTDSRTYNYAEIVVGVLIYPIQTELENWSRIPHHVPVSVIIGNKSHRYQEKFVRRQSGDSLILLFPSSLSTPLPILSSNHHHPSLCLTCTIQKPMLSYVPQVVTLYFLFSSSYNEKKRSSQEKKKDNRIVRFCHITCLRDLVFVHETHMTRNNV